MDIKALWQLSYGLYVVSSKSDDVINGQIANTGFQITAEPVCVAVAINKQKYTQSLIKASGLFTLSVLSLDTPMELIGKFGFQSGRTRINCRIELWIKPGRGALFEGLHPGLARFEADRSTITTHTIFVGELTDAEVLMEGIPLTYAHYYGEGWHCSQNGPTYRQPEERISEEPTAVRCVVTFTTSRMGILRPRFRPVRLSLTYPRIGYVLFVRLRRTSLNLLGNLWGPRKVTGPYLTLHMKLDTPESCSDVLCFGCGRSNGKNRCFPLQRAIPLRS